MGHTRQKTGFEFFSSRIIVDDVLLTGHTDDQFLAYFRAVLDIHKHHHAKLKLKR